LAIKSSWEGSRQSSLLQKFHTNYLTLSRFEEIAKSLLDFEGAKTSDLTRVAMEEGVPAIEILNRGLLPGMKKVGEQFRSGEIFLPEVLLAGKAIKEAMSLLKPAFQKEGVSRRGTFAIGTVKDDIHDIGKNLVIMMLEGNGWEVTDLGVDVPTEQFCSAVGEKAPDILGLSALLTTTITRLPEVIQALEAKGLRKKIKIMVGGAVVTQAYADKIGADGFAPNAVEAVEVAELLLNR
jgi:5-methyltetrahydrofolate--homocysteine methyltransferase